MGECELVGTYRKKSDVVEEYQMRNLHIQYNREDIRDSGDVGMVIYDKTV